MGRLADDFGSGIGPKRNYVNLDCRRGLPILGTPDLVFPQLKFVVFGDGYFWHCCPKHATRPASTRVFWRDKLQANQRRDRLVNRTLRAQGWRVLRIWEHELKNEPAVARKIERAMHGMPAPDAAVCRRIRRRLA